MTSRISSSRLLASSGDVSDRPVILPPGFDRLATRPVPRGSATVANTIGMTEVACFAANTGGPRCDNNINLEPDKFRGDLRETLGASLRSEEHTSELQSLRHLVCRLLL